ncbi:MAG: 50S ribosomal protein L4 [Anaerolineae bacterium]|mgnify:CR=1 FL=1|jgi:large subunit ribosomal protein L4|nr:50S ribosomal protein L4 [Anaerolineae bacterium]MBT7071428.1 50S ribosomal protein L4 [Anaerolineae bacterium]MBT7326172.1 50S ribosomal protein L4 [Anaerolineae bacterium]
MKVDLVNIAGEKLRKVELPAEVFEAPINVDLMHQAYVRQMANARLGTHKTKSRGEVSGGGRKPWRQKGTGRARQGTIRAPQWVGGGRVHTPRPRSYEKKMPRKMRQAALRSALSVKAGEANVVVVDTFALAEPKTRFMAEALGKLVGDASALLLLPEKDQEYDVAMRTADNISDAKVLLAGYLNIRDLIGFDKIVISLKTLDVLKAHLG